MAMSKRTVPRDVHSEHKAIFDATLARDVELACKLTGDHIERTLTVFRLAFGPNCATTTKNAAEPNAAKAPIAKPTAALKTPPKPKAAAAK